MIFSRPSNPEPNLSRSECRKFRFLNCTLSRDTPSVWLMMDYAQAAPSLSQAQRIKKLAQEGECTLDAMCEIMNEIKKGELDRVTFKTDSLRKYFPKSYTNKQMEDKIIQLLEQWQKKREKSMER